MVKRLLTTLLVGALFFLIPLSISQPLRDLSLRLFTPLAHPLIHSQNRLSNLYHSLTQIGQLRSDRENLQKEVVTLQQELAKAQNLAQENIALRKELGVTGTTLTFPKVFSHVIIRGSNPLDRTFTIDAGSAQGVHQGQPAIYQGFLVGQVIEVRTNSSIIRSINSRESRLQAWISDNREKGLLTGDGNAVYLNQISQGVTIKEQSIVETSGLGGSLPQGILIGQLGAVQSKPSDLTQSFLVQPLQDYTNIESVFILLTDHP